MNLGPVYPCRYIPYFILSVSARETGTYLQIGFNMGI